MVFALRGINNCFVNFKTGEIEIDYNKYAVHKTIMPTRNLAFANHLFVSLKSEPQLIQRTLKIIEDTSKIFKRNIL